MIKDALILIGIALLFSGLIWGISWVIGISKLEEDYLKEYEELHKLVYYGDTTTENFNLIMSRLPDLRRYKCADKEKIDVMQVTFYRRFCRL